MSPHQKFLAFDTSTDRMSVALGDGERVWQHSGPGGAQASTTLLPSILALLAEAAMALDDLDAIAFGRGPGSFTGLRTACAVAQGLAFGAAKGAGLPVLPVDTLMAVAEEARFQQPPGARSFRVTALLDARMDEMYVQELEFAQGVWRSAGDCALVRPENFVPGPHTQRLAGNVFTVYADRLSGVSEMARQDVLPTASAMLRLAPALMAAGLAVDASQALPLYVRDKVAFTTEERAQAKARAATAGAAA
jgi:tRNA threonylcarbamoyladenosine biosynthesis protein TsaB